MVIISWERGKHKGTGWQRPGAFHPACGQKHALHAPEKQAAAGARLRCRGLCAEEHRPRGLQSVHGRGGCRTGRRCRFGPHRPLTASRAAGGAGRRNSRQTEQQAAGTTGSRGTDRQSRPESRLLPDFRSCRRHHPSQRKSPRSICASGAFLSAAGLAGHYWA